uniref:DDE-type integrase/transposase/recombinase n=1 Tax=Pyxidicoccus xibeiensis TaxID=2906759 RepID=UPI0038998C78
MHPGGRHHLRWTAEGRRCVALVLDHFSRRVVGWSMGERIDWHLVLAAFDMALAVRAGPALHPSGRGSQRGLPSAAQCVRHHLLHEP